MAGSVRRLLVGVATLVLVAAGCAGDPPEPGEQEAFDGVTINATDWTFDVPSQIDASTVNFRLVNDGDFAHEAVLMKLGDQSREDFFEEFDALVASEFEGPIPDALFNGTQQVGDVQPGEDPFVTGASMTGGTWLLFCALSDAETEGGEQASDEQNGEGTGDDPDERPHYQRGMYAEIEVTGDDEPEPPSGDATVTIRDYTFEAELSAGEQTLVAVNEGPDQLHHIVAFDAGTGVDPAEAEEQFRAMAGEEGAEGGEEEEGAAGEPAAEEPEEAFFTGIMSPGYGQTAEVDLESGHTYIFACFIHDRAGGAPHAFSHDMIKAFAVP